MRGSKSNLEEKIGNKIGAVYDPSAVEPKWQKVWEEKKTFQVDLEKANKPFYNLVMFPYPSAEGLHVGHIIPYSGSDTYGRYMRMKGFDVFEPMGFDAFGIHSENFAIKKGIHPAKLTAQTTKYFKDEQMKKLGTMFDWERMVDTSNPDYYRWTQWLFVQMFKAGLAVRKKAVVNWCPSCKTVLSDEQVVKAISNKVQVKSNENSIDVCERCKTEVERREMEQWFFKITKFSQKLLDNLEKINWSRKTITAQRNWIGRSEGVNIIYEVVDEEGNKTGEVTCFTTRPDTNFGATFVVLSPEHPIVASLLKSKISSKGGSVSDGKNQKSPPKADPPLAEKIKTELENYIKFAKNKSEQERIAEGREKTGVFTGFYCINNLNGEKMPLWISDFVVMGFGTGAVVGVPGHDKRDFQFAQKFNLPIKRVVVEKDGDKTDIAGEEEVFEGEGTIINSGFLDSLETRDAKVKIADFLEEKGWGSREVHFKLRDWCISRQRYWGPPIPMVYCLSCSNRGITYNDLVLKQKKSKISAKGGSAFGGKTQNPEVYMRELFSSMAGWFPVPEEDLPVLLPESDHYLPDGSGKSPLAKISTFVKIKCPNCGGEAERETDVSDTFLDSSWYFLRYPSVKDQRPNTKDQKLSDLPFDLQITKKWLPVNMYVGGNEHACLHLMYSRFVTMALHEMGYLTFDEPFEKFYAHGLMIKNGAKMSKSRGNVVNPDIYLKKYGADALRMYVLFLGPYDAGGDFRDGGIEGMTRFLGRIYRWGMTIVQDIKVKNKNQIENEELTINNDLSKKLNKLIKNVGEDLENLKFNTAIAKMMEFLNSATGENGTRDTFLILENYLLLLAPFAPHLAEEMYQKLRMARGESDFVSVHDQKWPDYDPEALWEEELTIVVQVNGKLRGKLIVRSEKVKNKEEIIEYAKNDEKIKNYLDGKEIRNSVYIEGKLINFVI